VLWTRLALDPIAPDGLGGMPSRSYAVQWQVASDERFHHVVRSGVAVARPEHAHSIHVTIDGLRPGREYWYRFRSEGRVSGTGRALTAPERGTTPRELAMSFVSCSQFEHGWFTAYRRLAEDRPDLVLHCLGEGWKRAYPTHR
jgi:alkaline phosphatase D